MKQSSRTEVSITIDTEFSIAGALKDPERFPPVGDRMVYCHAGGEEQGLGFLLDLFDRFQIPATFFVETANYHYFGDAPMREVVRRIQAASQDVQLHIHPIWFYFNQNRALGDFQKNDTCVGREYEELKRIFVSCMAIFEQWVGRRPDAIRTGSLFVDRQVYQVMSELEIPLASNIGLGLYQPEDPDLHLAYGRTLIEGVVELPVFTYKDSPLLAANNLKSIQITACSWPEMKSLLWRAREAGISNVVILTHPFEFVKRSDGRFTRMTRNRINQQRISNLCQFINQHDEDFVAVDFGNSRDRWLEKDQPPEAQIAVPDYYKYFRKLHNFVNDKVWSY